MTIKEEIKRIQEILIEDGLSENEEEILKRKIALLEKIISDPAKYKDYESLPTYLRYQSLKRVAMEINAADTKTVEEWKIPIEKKIAECQEKISSVDIMMVEEAMTRQKRELYRGIIGEQQAETIAKGRRSLKSEVEDLREAALEVNPIAVQAIDEWDLTEDQKDYLFVQERLGTILNTTNPKVSEDDINRLAAIKKRVADPETGKNELTKEMKNLLSSSTIRIIFEAYKRNATRTQEGLENMGDSTEQPKEL